VSDKPEHIRRASETKATDEEVNKFRKLHGLEPLRRREKDCLKCGQKFESQGPYMRMCQSCRSHTY